jgi:hypothetical protein
VNPQTQVVNPQTQVVNPQIQVVNPETQVVNPETQVVNTQNGQITMNNQEATVNQKSSFTSEHGTNSGVNIENFSAINMQERNKLQKLSEDIKDMIEAIENQYRNSLFHYNITGGKGWQRICGYIRGTDLQPIQIIKDGNLYGFNISHSGMGVIPVGSIYICKNNKENNIPSNDSKSVIGIIHIKNEINKPFNKTLMPDETFEDISWESRSVELTRDDHISIYAENLSGSNIGIYIEY